MTEPGRGSSRWNRFAEEVVSIVVGILLALAAQAGYQYLADRASEREMLRALRAEFAADVTELGADQRYRTRKLASIDLLAAVRTGAAKSPPPDTLASALREILDYRFYTASHPVLDDALVTGRLELIRSDDLRQALMVFGQARSRIGVIEQREREFVASQLEPYLGAQLDLGAMTSGSPEVVAAALRSLAAAFADNRFGSLLYVNRSRTQNSFDSADRLLGTVVEVQRLLGEGD